LNRLELRKNLGFAQKKGVWNFEALKTPHLLRLESSRHLFLGKAKNLQQVDPYKCTLHGDPS